MNRLPILRGPSLHAEPRTETNDALAIKVHKAMDAVVAAQIDATERYEVHVIETTLAVAVTEASFEADDRMLSQFEVRAARGEMALLVTTARATDYINATSASGRKALGQ